MLATRDELKKLNSELYDALQKEKGKVRTLTTLLASVKNDTIYIGADDIIQHDSAGHIAIPFEHKDKWSFVKGSTAFNYMIQTSGNGV